MKQLRIGLLIIFVFGLTSCDSTMYVAVRNHREPTEVRVTYQKSAARSFTDTDTLRFTDISNNRSSGILVRKNTSKDTYSFIAPKQKEIELMPIEINAQPIKQIQIIISTDSVWTINLWDRHEFKRLRNSGSIKTTKVFLFTTSIIVDYQ